MKKAILVIDDESPLCELLKGIIEEDNSGELCVDYATNYQEAIDKLSKKAYDLVFVDIKLSESASGIDILKKCKDLGVKSKFVIYSALGKQVQYPILVREGVSEMIIDYLEKNNDLTIDQLMSWIKTILYKPEGK